MKKLISTLTALTFALGLTTAGFCQTAAKEEGKGAVKMESQVKQPETTAKEAEKPKTEDAKGVTKTEDKGAKKDAGKTKTKKVEKKVTGKDDKKTGAKVEDPKKAEPAN
jgi:hypothetical protein